MELVSRHNIGNMVKLSFQKVGPHPPWLCKPIVIVKISLPFHIQEFEFFNATRSRCEVAPFRGRNT